MSGQEDPGLAGKDGNGDEGMIDELGDGGRKGEKDGSEETFVPKVTTGKGEGDKVVDDDESVFDSESDLEEIIAAMEDVKKEEEKAIREAMDAIRSGTVDMEEQLENMSEELAQKIQAELDETLFDEDEIFVSEEEFVKKNSNAHAKIWYHCLYHLVFTSEDGRATKRGLYERLKDVCSKSPIDPIPEHMFNFGLSALLKVYLYDKPVVGFKQGEFFLQVDKKKLQELLLKIGRPMSRRPVITKEEEKDMFTKFFDTDDLLSL